jgi:hypothetical protein
MNYRRGWITGMNGSKKSGTIRKRLRRKVIIENDKNHLGLSGIYTSISVKLIRLEACWINTRHC